MIIKKYTLLVFLNSRKFYGLDGLTGYVKGRQKYTKP